MGEDPPRRGTRQALMVTVSREPGLPRLAVAPRQLQRVATAVLEACGVRLALVSISLVGRRAIARVHRRITGVGGATDVVTLQHARPGKGAPVVGEVWISPEVARDHARDLGIPVREELRRLVVHGTLHTIGWTHPTGPGREVSAMWRLQERLLAKAGRRGGS